MKQSWSLRLRLTLLVGLLTGGAVLLFAAIFYIKLQSNLLQEIDGRLRERAALVADALRLSGEHFDETPDLPALPPLAEFDAPGIYVELLDADGVVRATSPNLGADRLPARPELVSTVLAGATTTETVPAGGDEDVRLLASPIHLMATPATILLVAESMEPLERTLDQAQTSDYDALLLPGGVMNPDRLRTNPKAVDFAREFFDSGKPIAVICHGPWTLVEAGVLRGVKITSWPSLQTDLRNAGADWVDREVVVDRGIVSSRKPDDMPAFNRKMIEEFAEGLHGGGGKRERAQMKT